MIVAEIYTKNATTWSHAKLEGPIRIHNVIKQVWWECLTELNFQHSKEPTHRYLNNDNRPDIAVINPQTGHDIELDISLAHPWCTDLLGSAASIALQILLPQEKREKKRLNTAKSFY